MRRAYRGKLAVLLLQCWQLTFQHQSPCSSSAGFEAVLSSLGVLIAALANGQRNLNFSATCVYHSIGWPFTEEGWYCHCCPASMAAGPRPGGRLRNHAPHTPPSLPNR